MKKVIYSLATASLCIFLTTHESHAFYSQKGKTYAYGSFGFALSQVNLKVTGSSVNGSGSKKNYNKILEVGVGKYITDSIRSDISASIYIGKKRSSLSMNNLGNAGNFRVKMRSYSITWNVYYNLLLQSQASPYIMAGLGFGQQDVNLGDAATKFNKSQGGLLYSVGAGVDWHLGAQLDMSIGYKLTTLSNTKGVTIDNSTGASPYKANVKIKNTQSIMLGMRKTF